MNTKTKTLIGALIALAVLAGAYFGAEAWQAWQKKKAAASLANVTPPDPMILINFNSFDINRVEIPTWDLVIEKDDTLWQLVSPAASVRSGITIDQEAIWNRIWNIATLRAERIVGVTSDDPTIIDDIELVDDTEIADELLIVDDLLIVNDLSLFGLDNPSARAIVSDSDGKRVALIFGDWTPDRSAFYAMREGDPKVYTVSARAVMELVFTLDDIRQRALLPDFDPHSLSRIILEKPDQRIEIEATQKDAYLVSTFSRYVLVSPYKLPRGAGSDRFGNIQLSLGTLSIDEFIDEEPESLVPYGLDKPGRLYVESPECTMDLYYGSGQDRRLYAKLADKPWVFTVPDLPSVIDLTAFDIFDKFLVIFHINMVKDFTVSGEGRRLFAEIRGTQDEPEFYINGQKIEDGEFRTYYQSVIVLSAEAEYPGSSEGGYAEGSKVNITFNLKDPANTTISTDLVPFNRDFYSVTQGGVTEFLVSQSQIQRIFDAADKVMGKN